VLNPATDCPVTEAFEFGDSARITVSDGGRVVRVTTVRALGGAAAAGWTVSTAWRVTTVSGGRIPPVRTGSSTTAESLPALTKPLEM